MKRLTTFLLTLLLFTLGASAQTDFTWALNAGTWNNYTGFYSDGVERYISTDGGYSEGKVLYETVTGLPAGTYTVTFYATANFTPDRGFTAAYGNDIAQVFANNTTQDITVGTNTSVTLGNGNEYTLECTVGVDGILEYGIQNIAAGGNWYVCQGVSLTYSETYVPVAGDKVYGCKAEIGHWTATGNTGGESFQKNTWSNAEGMSVPTCEYWVYDTSNLTAATISHETLTGLQAGTYEISIAASATAENTSGSVGEGTTFNANEASVDLTTGTYSVPSGMGGNYCGTYTLTATVGEEGTLDISFTIPSGVTYNWLQFQDLSVTLKELAVEEEDPYIYDVTSLLANPSFELDDVSTWTVDDTRGGYTIPDEGLTGWTLTNASNFDISELMTKDATETDNNLGVPGEAPDGDYMLYVKKTWAGNLTASITQTPTLPAGDYKLVVSSKCFTGGSSANLVAGEDTQAITIDGTSAGTTDSHPMTNLTEWTTNELTFTVTDEGEVKLGIEFTLTNTSPGSFVFDNFQLFSKEDVAAEVGEEVYLEVYECGAEFDHWSIANNTNGSFQLNTWSTEADESGMTTPFIEYWAGSGVNLSNATINHKALSLDPGTYKVSIFARAFNENSDVDVSEGIEFSVNGTSVDLATGTTATYNGVSQEVYGTYEIECTTTDGNLNIGFSVYQVTGCDWLAFKNLKVEQLVNTSSITLADVEGRMNATVESTMKAAIATFESSRTAEDYYAAIEAIEAAEASVALYAELTAMYNDVVPGLDEDGAAFWESSDAGMGYEANGLTEDNYDLFLYTLIAAQEAQTTPDTDWSYVLKYTGEWKHDEASSVGNFQICPSLTTAHEAWRSTTFGGSADSPSMPLYKEITALQAGVYTVSFYAYAAQGAEGDVIVFANDATSTITVDATNAGPDWSNEAELITLTCEVGEDGILDFGLKCIGAGAWYVAEEYSLTFVSYPVLDDDEYEVGEEIVIDGVRYNVVSENMFVNGGFNDGVDGWTAGNGTSNYETPAALTGTVDGENVTYFTIDPKGGKNDGAFITTNGAGANSPNTLTQAIAVEPGKSYLFIGYTNGDAPSETNKAYNALFQMDSSTHEKNHEVVGDDGKVDYPSIEVVEMLWDDADDDYNGWTRTEGVFTVPTDADDTYSYVGMRMGWNSNSQFDGFQLYEVEADIIETGEYMVVDPATGLYIGGGLDYGTHLTMLKKPQFFGVEYVPADEENGIAEDGYLINSHQYNAAEYHYLGIVDSKPYTDREANTWRIGTPAEGGYLIFTMYDVDGTGEVPVYLAAGAADQDPVTIVTDEADATIWSFVTLDEAIEAADLDNVSATTPAADITPLILFPEMKRFSSNVYDTTVAWSGENVAYGYNDTAAANCAEAYHHAFSAVQTITLPKAGSYTLTAQAFYRDDTEDATGIVPMMFAGDDAVEIPDLYSAEGATAAKADDPTSMNMADAYEDFLAGLYPVSLNFVTDADNQEVEIGFENELSDVWAIFGELTLLYNGEEVLEDTDSDYHEGDVATVDGVDYDVLSDNLIDNHSFELGFTGWTSANDFTTEITDAKFDWVKDGTAEDGLRYIVGTTNSSASSDGSLGTAWEIEPGKTYYFSYWIKNLDGTEETEYLKTSLTNEPGTETLELGYPETVSEEWQKVEYVFTNGEEGADDCYAYVQVKFRWLENHWGFDNFQIYEVEEVPVVGPAVEDGEYLVMDADGNYLGGGLYWGTEATIIGKPQFIGFEMQENGAYTLDSHQYNGETAHYLGSNLYFDSTPVEWTITEVEGGYTIYGTVDDGTGYLTSNGFQEAVSVEADPYVWTLVTMDDVVASMETAKESAPVDVTALIASPELKRNSNTDYYPTWTVVEATPASETDGNGFAFGGGSAIANCGESYHSSFDIQQEIILPKAGTYQLSAQGFYRIDNINDNNIPVMYAGDKNVELQILNTSANTMAEAYQEFLQGLHPVSPITITAEEDGQPVIIGFAGEDVTKWVIMGELTLTYYGVTTSIEPGDVVHECVAEESHWTIAGNTNGVFQYNTWSTETDASGMTPPLLEYWVWSGEGTLSAATISHETLTNLPEGTYEVSLDVRIFSEAGNEITAGTTLNANGSSIDVVAAGTADVYGTETEVYGTYVLTCTVGEDGTLDINLDIPEGVTYNWIAFKNLTVTYLNDEVEGAYTFKATDWVSLDLGRVTEDGIVYNDDNTITVTATGQNNVALGNSTSYGVNGPFTTANKYVTDEQNWFVVIGTDLSTADGDSYIWWMNGYNNGMQVAPTLMAVLPDGQIMLAWDLTQSEAGTNLQDDENYLDGWTGFGVTSETGVTIISDINFYTYDDVMAIISGTATIIENVETATAAPEGIYTLDGVRISKITKSGIYIVDGKKVLVK